MAQLGWTVLTKQGRQYKIGLYHGMRTGHLLIHCNGKVLQIDFNVRQDKVYSFFLDDQLYEVKVVREGNRFGYTCAENEQVDTPVNRERKVEDKKNWKKMILLLFSILVLVLTGLYFTGKRQHVSVEEKAALLSSQPTEMTKLRLFKKDHRWHYSYFAKDQIIQDKLPVSEHHPLGFPFIPGDEIMIKYSISQPHVYEFLWQAEIPEQINKYSELAGTIHQRLHPELDPRQVRCQLQLAYDLKGLFGLSSIYHQNISPDSLPDFNENTYLRLIRSEDFEREVKACL